MKAVKRIVGILVFTLIFFLMLSEFSAVLMHKQTEGRWNMTAKVVGFYNEEPYSFDVLFFGSSHMYCSVDPGILFEETGLSSYVFATQQQPLWITYHYMVEGLKKQSPKTAIVEIHMAAYNEGEYIDSATNHTAIDPIPLSENKIQMVKASAPYGEWRYYIFNIMKYHDRWEELEMSDYLRSYEKSTDPEKGYVRLEEVSSKPEQEEVSEITESKEIIQKNCDYINKIIDLANENGIELILFKSPSNASIDEKMYYNRVGELAAERNVNYIDFNSSYHYERMQLDIEQDFYDQRHLNESGVKKFVPYFADFLFR